jgi:glycosyltransferase involved in cell wall biosynthesis
MSGPDIAHTHSSKAGALGRVAARIAGIPVIVHTVHGPPFHDRQPAPVRWLIQSIERHLSVWTDKIVTVADAMGDDFVRQGICSRDRLRTIVSGIDVQRLLAVAPGARSLVRSEFGIPHDAVVVVGIGRLSRGKNFDLLLDAATEIRQARSDVYVLIVGEGEERAVLHHKIVANGLSGHVVLCGPRGDVGEILTAGDLFVQSSWHEGVSRSLVEAMYVGLPVVATDVVGTREVVREGQTGFLVPPGDARSMTDRIVLLLNDPQRRVEMGRAGQQLVSGKRDIEAMGKGLDTLYRELVKQRVPEREMAQSFSP